MKFLITGANGQVGFKLVELLKNKKYSYLALTKEQLDIGDEVSVEKIISEYLPDVIINAAAYTAVDKAESDKDAAYRVNADGPKNLAISAAKIHAAIFHISTDYVFDGLSSEAYRESDVTGPQGIYGASKLIGEKNVSENAPKHIILRTAWVFGEHGNNFVKTMIRLGRDRDQLGIVADQFGGPTYAGDIASTLVLMAERYSLEGDIPWGIYHYSGCPYVSWHEFAVAIFNEIKEQKIYDGNIPVLRPITTIEYPTPAKRPANSRLECKKIEKYFNKVVLSDWKHALKNLKAYS